MVAHLPSATRTDAGRMRRRILAVTTGSALALGLVLAIRDVPTLVQGLTPFANGAPLAHAANELAELVRRPIILYAGAAVITVSSFAILPFLRRWV